MTTKRIEWAQPNSANALKFAYGKTGCWILLLETPHSICAIGAHFDKQKLTELGNQMKHIEWKTKHYEPKTRRSG